MTSWRLSDRVLELPPPLAAGIVNVTDDSFFAGARSGTPERRCRATAWRWSRRASTCSTSAPSPAAQRPAGSRRARRPPGSSRPIEGLVRGAGVPVTADTFSPEVARARARRGRRRRSTTSRAAATRRCSSLVAERGCGYVLMHIEGPPRVDRGAPGYDDPVDHLRGWFAERHRGSASAAGSPRSRSRSTRASTSTSPSTTTSRSCAALGELRDARPAPVRRPLAQGLPRRGAGRLLGGAARRRRARVGHRRGHRAGRRRGRRDPAPPRLEALSTRCASPPRSPGPAGARDAAPAAVASASTGSRRPRAGSARSSRDARRPPGRRAASRRRAIGRARSRSRPRWRPTSRRRSRAAGIEALYSHQARGARGGDGAGTSIVTSGTASGKSLCFNLPVLDDLARDRGTPGALPLPDQGPGAGPGAKALGARPGRASPRDLRRRHPARRPARRSAGARTSILTNPDMLHVGLLPHHKSWGDFLANLGWVVVDEAHTYRGVFGSHVANVLRRLRRVAASYGARAALHARLGDDRQPGRARRAAGRRAVRAGRLRRRAARPAADRDVEPAGDRPEVDDPPLGALRGRGAARRPGRAGTCGRSASFAAAGGSS